MRACYWCISLRQAPAAQVCWLHGCCRLLLQLHWPWMLCWHCAALVMHVPSAGVPRSPDHETHSSAAAAAAAAAATAAAAAALCVSRLPDPWQCCCCCCCYCCCCSVCSRTARPMAVLLLLLRLRRLQWLRLLLLYALPDRLTHGSAFARIGCMASLQQPRPSFVVQAPLCSLCPESSATDAAGVSIAQLQHSLLLLPLAHATPKPRVVVCRMQPPQSSRVGIL